MQNSSDYWSWSWTFGTSRAKKTYWQKR
uniref:Uncharacterized protein n=1 Tax=Arundo donax TaxID=35708 RepID=A0A0A9EA02_ARUDO